jgi:hypothetical protein
MSFVTTLGLTASYASRRMFVRHLALVACGAALLATTLAISPADARRSKRRAAPADIAKSSAPNQKPAALASQPPAEPFPETASAKTQLDANGLKASLSANDAGTTVPVGSSTVVTLAIEGSAGNRTATVLAEAEGGEILAITGSGAKSSPVRGGLSSDIRLPASGSANVSIEMNLRGGTRGADGKSRNRLRITLLPEKGGKDESILSWGLADCAGDYHAELRKILEVRRELMMPVLESAIAADSAITGKWIFPRQSTSPLLICKGAKGKKMAACTGATAANSKDLPDAEAAWDEPHVLQLANDILAFKGALPGFQKRGQPLRQVSFTLLNSLKNYMEQEPHPALCTGVEAMLGYYRDRTPNLRNTIASIKAALPAAQKLSVAKVAELGSAPATTASTAELADHVAKQVLSATDASETSAITDPVTKLQHINALLDGETTKNMPVDKRSTALAALRLVEATLYIGAAAKKYTELDQAIYGTMTLVTDAYKSKCVCQ